MFDSKKNHAEENRRHAMEAYAIRTQSTVPDWEQDYTPEAAEDDIKGFKFKGTGWYLTKTDSMLVLSGTGVKNTYRFFCWNFGVDKDASWLSQLGICQDDR